MNMYANIKSNITNNNILINCKSLITNLSYSDCSPFNVKPIPSYTILNPSISHTCLSLTTHCVNIQPCILQDEDSLPNTTIMIYSYFALLDLLWFPTAI